MNNTFLLFRSLIFFLIGHLFFLSLSTALVFAQTQYSSYVDEKLGFSVDIPNEWESEVNGQALVFSGRQGTEQWRTTINFQVVESGALSLDLFIADLKSQWQALDSYRLISEQSGSLDGYRASRLLVEYLPKGEQELIRQEQVVVLHPTSFYLIGYTAPVGLFDRYYNTMARALESFRISIPPASPPDRTETLENAQVELHSFIKSIQEFRELNGSDGRAGWRAFANEDVLQFVSTLEKIIWPEGDSDAGWAYFFSLSITNISAITSQTPIVGFYHPWSDVWFITQWQKTPVPQIISVEILLGEWVRNGGEGPFDLTPAWLRGNNYRPEQLARTVAENILIFDQNVDGRSSWQKSLKISGNNSTVPELNYPAVSNALLFSWVRAMDIYDTDSNDPFLNSLLHSAMSFIEAGRNGNVAKEIAFSGGTNRHTQQTLNDLSSEFFALMIPVYWTADDSAATLYMIPGSNSDFCLTLRYIRDSLQLQLERVDLLNFPEILKFYKKQVSQ